MKKVLLTMLLGSLVFAAGCQNGKDDNSRNGKAGRKSCCSCGCRAYKNHN